MIGISLICLVSLLTLVILAKTSSGRRWKYQYLFVQNQEIEKWFKKVLMSRFDLNGLHFGISFTADFILIFLDLQLIAPQGSSAASTYLIVTHARKQRSIVLRIKTIMDFNIHRKIRFRELLSCFFFLYWQHILRMRVNGETLWFSVFPCLQ